MKTSDLNLAAALRLFLRTTPRIELRDRFSEFIFEGVDTAEAERLANDFYSDRLTGDLKAYSGALRDLKTMLMTARGGQVR